MFQFNLTELKHKLLKSVICFDIYTSCCLPSTFSALHWIIKRYLAVTDVTALQKHGGKVSQKDNKRQ